MARLKDLELNLKHTKWVTDGHCANKWIPDQIQMASIKCWGLHGIAMDLELCRVSKLGIQREGPGKGIPA